MTTTVVKLSQLLGLPVEDEDGRALGHLHDIRVRQITIGEPTRAPRYQADSLIVGPRGLRVRLGWGRSRKPDEVAPDALLAWKDVVAIEPDRLVVRRAHDSHARDLP
jgi:hypothetical protein